MSPEWKDKIYDEDIISKPILEHIIRTHHIVTSDPYYSEQLKNKELKAIENDGFNNNVHLELSLRGCKGTTEEEKEKERNSKDYVDIEQALINAKKYCEEHFNGKITPRLLQELGCKIHPEMEFPRWRFKKITLNLSQPPCNYVRVPDHINTLISDLKNIPNPVKQAVYSHLAIYRIQPINDGNKRLARLVQNAILHYNGYPAPIIPEFESDKYLKILNAAYDAQQDRLSSDDKIAKMYIAERNLYDYLGEKISTSLDNIKRRLDQDKKYEVIVISPKAQKPLMMGLKHSFSSIIRKRNLPGSVRLTDGRLIIKGPFEMGTLKTVIDSNYKIKKYEIRPYRK